MINPPGVPTQTPLPFPAVARLWMMSWWGRAAVGISVSFCFWFGSGSGFGGEGGGGGGGWAGGAGREREVRRDWGSGYWRIPLNRSGGK